MAQNAKKQKIEVLAKQMQIAGDPTRLKILCILFDERSACVSDIAKKLGSSVAAVSHHLLAMSRVNILDFEREGKKICYRLSSKAFAKDLKQFICKYK